MAYSTSSIIQWAKISQVLAFYDAQQKTATKGGYVDKDLHEKIYVERKSLEWEYAQDPSSDNLYAMGNYVFSLCFKYIFQAMVVSGSGGGSATPVVPNPSYVYNEIKKTVDGLSGSPVAGLTTYTNSDLIGGTDLNFIIVNNVPEMSGSDFSYDSSTGTITRNNQWVANDVVVIPYNQLV